MILVVDDDASIVGLVSLVLEREGYRVETATNGVAAYGHIKSPDCNGMLLDISMPKINGVELLMLMQAEDISVPTIVMSGFDDYDEKELKNFCNVVKYLQKPFDMDDMLRAVRKHAKPASCS